VPRILEPRAADARPNVVLVSIDTLRADFVRAYGYEHEVTPNIDRLASEGALFERAFTTYPSTTAAHVSMLTGFFPAVHGVYAPGSRLARAFPTLAETLAAHGYQTAAITENAMLSSSTGVTRGFAYYRELKGVGLETDGRVKEVVDGALDWLGRHRGERFFLFLHTYQVHGPYTPPAGYDVFRTWLRDGREVEVDAATPEAVKARLGYAGDLLYTDAQLGRLLAGLEALGEAERTIVVVTADHGEALGEHGVIGHGWYLIEPVLHVPLVIRAPGRVPDGVRIPAPASLADVTPTILDLAGVPIPPVLQGRSLVPLLDAPDDERFLARPVYTEKQAEDGRLSVAVRKGRFKWVDARPRDMTRYDLSADPGEGQGTSDPAALAEGIELVARYRAANDELREKLGAPQVESAPVDEATMQKLRALGYVD
jgi:arylsulfatase A-like enzyme